MYDLFLQALERPTAERAEFLAGACIDAKERAEAEQLLRQDELAAHDGFLEAGCSANGQSRLRDSLVGRRIGPYEVREWIASGGMGSVYRAVRLDDFSQDVAIKFVRIGCDTESTLRRFATERQVLAELDHPNIARILDGGATEDGRPYCVMELIDGRPIDRYCDEEQTPLRRRVELFLHVCAAVGHAHERGIVHRDLKPANVLAANDGTVKLTDFGIARFQEDGGGLTRTGDVLGTPSYLSPEQARGDVRAVGYPCDVHALGAILYELITGRQAFKGANWQETLDQVCRHEPVRPKSLQPNLPRDLETITLKCLAKEPARRYPSVRLLGEDLRRYLDGRPILARPISKAERLWRRCRRHPVVATLSAALAFVLIAGVSVVLSLWLLAESRGDQAVRERQAADRQRDRALAAVHEMVRLAQRRMATQPGTQQLQRELLLKAISHYDAMLAENPRDAATRHYAAQALRHLGNVEYWLGQPAKSIAAHARARDLWLQLSSEDPQDQEYLLALFHAHRDLSDALRTMKRTAEGRECQERAMRYAEVLVRRFPADLRYQDLVAAQSCALGWRAFRAGDLAAAAELFRRGLTVAEQLAADPNRQPIHVKHVATNLQGRASVRIEHGDLRAAESDLRRALGTWQMLADDPLEQYPDSYRRGIKLSLSQCRCELGQLLFDLDEPVEAESLLRESLLVYERLATDYPLLRAFPVNAAHTRFSLGLLHWQQGDSLHAEQEFHRCFETWAALAEQFPARRNHALRALALELCLCPSEQLRDPLRAERLAREILKRAASDSPGQLALGIALHRQGRFAEAIGLLRAVAGPAPGYRAMAKYVEAMVHRGAGRNADAHRCFEEGTKISASRGLSTSQVRRVEREAAALLGVTIERK